MNGKKYIGQRKFSKGWESYLGSGKILKKAIKKYGKENFLRKIIAIAGTPHELNQLEINLIQVNNATTSEEFYNISDGGKSGNNFAGKTESEMKEIKRKMSESTKGYHHTEESKEKISLANRGKIVSIESKEKMSKNHWLKNGGIHPFKGTHWSKGETNPMYGKKHTKESIEKNRLAHIGKNVGKDNANAKKVICLTTGRIFDTMREAKEYYNLKSIGNICSCCSGKLKSYGKLEDGTRLTWAYYKQSLEEVTI